MAITHIPDHVIINGVRYVPDTAHMSAPIDDGTGPRLDVEKISREAIIAELSEVQRRALDAENITRYCDERMAELGKVQA
jgi:hypothetical protein